MCGFAGVVGRHPPDRAALERRAETLAHRGPDGRGIEIVSSSGGAVHAGLAHRRLMIQDLTERAAQPMADPSGRCRILYNGEIYNAPELRAGLEARGVRFRSTGDTEVLAALLADEGPEAVRRLEGMFAFALFDRVSGELVLARDRFGEKPLHYAATPDGVHFASEIRALLDVPGVDRRLDLEALDHYLSLGFVPAPWTMYRGIRKLPHGCWARVSGKGFEIRRYYDVRDAAGGPPLAPGEARARLRATLRDAVRARLVSDVPLGAFLSGGVDSSLVVGLMAEVCPGRLHTFSLGFDRERLFDERAHARLVARRHGTRHHEVVLTAEEARRALPRLLDSLDEPLGDPSLLPTWLLCRGARGAFTVALAGDGSDEIFAGYRKYAGEGAARLYLALPRALRRAVLDPLALALPASRGDRLGLLGARARKFMAGVHGDRGARAYGWMRKFGREERARLLGRAPEAGDPGLELVRGLVDSYPGGGLNASLYADLQLTLPGQMLAKVDRCSMAHGLEVRCPFLDHRLVELAFRLPPEAKRSGRRGKRVLLEACGDLLPPGIARRRKQGFDVPIGEWFKAELKDLFFEVTGSRPGLLLDPAEVRALHAEHASARADHTDRLWSLFVLSWWATGPHAPLI